jgi:hypothetical protein
MVLFSFRFFFESCLDTPSTCEQKTKESLRVAERGRSCLGGGTNRKQRSWGLLPLHVRDGLTELLVGFFSPGLSKPAASSNDDGGCSSRQGLDMILSGSIRKDLEDWAVQIGLPELPEGETGDPTLCV